MTTFTMKTTRSVTLFLLATLSTAGCGDRALPGLASPLEEIRSLHTRAHLEGDAALIVSTFTPVMTSVQNGRVTESTLEQSLEGFSGYFGNQDVLVWADMIPADIRYSPDSSMAHVIAQKRVITREKGSDAGPDTTDYAWTELWRVRDGAWKVELTATTIQRRGL